MANAQRGRASLNDRLEFMGMDQNARAALRNLQPLIDKSVGPALDAFYDKVKATPETRKLFGDEKHMAGAKGAQERHWGIIAGANYGEEYVNAGLRIGKTHARIGLRPRWYLAGYPLVLPPFLHP